uniref:Uncharacterized protein n=1 Tax=Rhizophora mucronata TaxID=61149 RepID=A0A2P2NRW2_RHIMU
MMSFSLYHTSLFWLVFFYRNAASSSLFKVICLFHVSLTFMGGIYGCLALTSL